MTSRTDESFWTRSARGINVVRVYEHDGLAAEIKPGVRSERVLAADRGELIDPLTGRPCSHGCPDYCSCR
jgi:hypothetical protein